ncbi:MAG: ankyrin repeat domain-containing protein [Candidatus Thiodiazotropha taylori]|nr:ankyrin repeat domain-containing protein [Candidatus Thiodiazotropha taylori]
MKRLTLLFTILLLASACSEQNSDTSDSELSDNPPLIIAAEAGDLPTIRKLIEGKSPVDVKDACMWTPLMKAALNGHLQATQSLLDAGAKVNQVDKGGYSALMLAVSNNHHQIAELLLNHGANINQIETTGGWSALIWAAKLGHTDSVATLLEHNANTELMDFDDLSALDWAKKNQHNTIVRLLETVQSQ